MADEDLEEVQVDELTAHGDSGSMPLRRSPDYRAYYSNTTQFLATQIDVCLIFGRLLPDENGGGYHEQTCSVGISWEQAKVLAIILGQQVHQHEQDFGPLVIRPKSKARPSPNPSAAEFVDIPPKIE
jgi:hypothetical protein